MAAEGASDKDRCPDVKVLVNKGLQVGRTRLHWLKTLHGSFQLQSLGCSKAWGVAVRSSPGSLSIVTYTSSTEELCSLS